MEFSKSYALLLVCMVFMVSATTILSCPTCEKPPPKHHKPKGPITIPPITLPPIVKPPINLPPVKPPIEIPPITLPPIVKPPIDIPPVKPPVDIPPIKPPIDLPPVGLPPILGPGTPSTKPCPSPPAKVASCPIDTLKLGGCVDLLGGMVHIGFGDPTVNQCCPVLQGLVEIEAAACLCTTLKIKALNLSIYVPLALQLLITCGKTPPPGYTCSL